MTNWHDILRTIFSPPLGSLWIAPNGIWNNSFASNRDANDVHPSVVGNVLDNGKRCWLIPGTSKNYNKGTNVFHTKIVPDDPTCPLTYFLIKYRMTMNSESVADLDRGWNGIDTLNDDQVKELKLQIKFSLGIDV